jgi:predicted PolB exonuclease-like 3'-5' exonuclease
MMIGLIETYSFWKKKQIKVLLDAIRSITQVILYRQHDGQRQTEIFHPHMIINIDLLFHIYEHSYRTYAAGDYNTLYSIMFNYDRSQIYNNISADASVVSLNAAVH